MTNIQLKNLIVKSFIARGVMVASLATLLIGLSTSAFAGLASSNPVFCSQAVNIVTCSGSMQGIRNQTTDPTQSARFLRSFDGTNMTLRFSVQANGARYICVAPYTTAWSEMWNAVLAANAYFTISFDVTTGVTNAKCTYLSASNGSAEKNVNAL